MFFSLPDQWLAIENLPKKINWWIIVKMLACLNRESLNLQLACRSWHSLNSFLSFSFFFALIRFYGTKEIHLKRVSERASLHHLCRLWNNGDTLAHFYIHTCTKQTLLFSFSMRFFSCSPPLSLFLFFLSFSVSRHERVWNDVKHCKSRRCASTNIHSHTFAHTYSPHQCLSDHHLDSVAR